MMIKNYVFHFRVTHWAHSVSTRRLQQERPQLSHPQLLRDRSTYITIVQCLFVTSTCHGGAAFQHSEDQTATR